MPRRERITPRESGAHQRHEALAALALDAAERFEAAGDDAHAREAEALAITFRMWPVDNPAPLDRIAQTTVLNALLAKLPKGR